MNLRTRKLSATLLILALSACGGESSKDNKDTDLDGTPDRIDIFPNDANEQVDTDGDGIGDNADAFPNDVTEHIDTDGDGVGDNADAFPEIASEQKDTDGDGFGDNSDIFPNDISEHVDTDGDGTGDNSDAFPTNSAAQKDSDGDGLADNADVFPNDINERIDTDGDGIGDNGDNCFLLHNPKQRDHNQDGLGDLCSMNDTSVAFTVLEDRRLTDSECIASNETSMNQQDCANGRDAIRRSGMLKKYGQGRYSMDYTKLSAAGEELPFETASWDCARDNVTGYIWEVKTTGDITNIHHKDHRYAAIADNVTGSDTCPYYDGSNGIECSLESFIEKTNSANFCGRDNWALPKVIDAYSMWDMSFRVKENYDDLDFHSSIGYFYLGDVVQETYDGNPAMGDQLLRLRFSGGRLALYQGVFYGSVNYKLGSRAEAL